MDYSPAIAFKCVSFEELSLEQLYDLMALRQAVFVVEQDCPYLDADGRDQAALHLLGYNPGGLLAAYARLFGPGIIYQEYASIGRVATASQVRGSGLGRYLMQEALYQIGERYPGWPIKISAQYYLIRFYESFGFRPLGESYLEDGIPHIAMLR